MKTTVEFFFMEEFKKWGVVVNGVENELEAKQAFNAVILTCRSKCLLTLKHQTKELAPSSYEIIPAVLNIPPIV